MSTTSSSSPATAAARIGPVASQFPQAKAAPPYCKVLIVDADPSVVAACEGLASKLGIWIRAVDSIATAQGILAKNNVDMLLLDLDLTKSQGTEQLESLHASHPEMAIVVVTAAATVQTAVQAMRLGAADFLTAPLAINELTELLERAAQRISRDAQAKALQRNLTTKSGMGLLVGHSPAMDKVYRMISKVAFTSHPVMIVGESGVGKELVARTIHSNGPHANRPFVPVYCASLSAETLERELFGYAKGYFPAAPKRRAGLLVEADSGTVFFDGVEKLSLELQSKLVRVLQQREVLPLGSHEPVPIHARFIASTDADIFKMQESGAFRRDLFFRLNVVNIRVSPLRERREDIPLLTDHILGRIRQETGVPYELNSEMREVLAAHDWPGNVRELDSALERASVMASDPFLTAKDFASQIQMHPSESGVTESNAEKSFRFTSIADLEKEAILSTIQQLRGDKLKAAKLLGIGKTTLYRKLKEYGIELPNMN